MRVASTLLLSSFLLGCATSPEPNNPSIDASEPAEQRVDSQIGVRAQRLLAPDIDRLKTQFGAAKSGAEAKRLVRTLALDDPQLAAFRRVLAQQRDPNLREYPDTQAAVIAATRFDPDRPLLIGKRMPDWSYPSLDGEGMIGSEQLRGRPYLLDVWSTYCGPCVEDMQHLHEAHAELGRSGEDPPIAFVALSIDETRELPEQFRRERWPMPWIHAWGPEHRAGRAARGLALRCDPAAGAGRR